MLMMGRQPVGVQVEKRAFQLKDPQIGRSSNSNKTKKVGKNPHPILYIVKESKHKNLKSNQCNGFSKFDKQLTNTRSMSKVKIPLEPSIVMNCTSNVHCPLLAE